MVRSSSHFWWPLLIQFCFAEESTFSAAVVALVFLTVGLAPSTGCLVEMSTLSFLLAGVVEVVVKEMRSLLFGDSGLFYSISLYLAFYSAFSFCFFS
jgi:hypothetical protein